MQQLAAAPNNGDLNQTRPRIIYSDRYADDDYEYRHVILPPDLAKILPKSHLLTETEWRNIGVQQSPGWVHYMNHLPEPHILLFRRSKSHPTPSDYGRHPLNNNNNNNQDINGDNRIDLE